MLKQIIACGAILLSTLVAFAKEDVIVIKGKGEREVSIVNETNEIITFKDLKTGATQKVKVDLVEMVKYKDAHSSFEDAMNAISNKNWPFALQRISEARKKMKGPTKNNWHVSYLGYYTGKILAEFAKSNTQVASNAEKFLNAFIKSGSKSRFYPHAFNDLAELYMLTKRYDDARKALNGLEKASGSPAWKGIAQAGVAKTYLLEDKAKEALAIGTKLLGAGVVNPAIMDVFSVVLVDNGADYDKAYNLAGKLLTKGDAETKEKVHELRGCAAFHMKKYEEALEALLKAQLLYGSKEAASPRLNVYLAATIHVLMKKKPSAYGAWEYNGPYVSLRKGLNVAGTKKFSKLVQKI